MTREQEAAPRQGGWTGWQPPTAADHFPPLARVPDCSAAHCRPCQHDSIAAPTACPCSPGISPADIAPLSKEEMSRTVRGVVLAGGQTNNPLTRHRAMPAVPLGSSLLMIDVPLNLCLQAGVNKM